MVMTPPPVVVAPAVTVQQPIKVQTPELFNGTKKNIDVFIVQLRLCFRFQPAQFESEASKILYAASYLCGAAAEWFVGYLEDYLDNMNTPGEQAKETKIMFASFENFTGAITRIYGNLDQYK